LPLRYVPNHVPEFTQLIDVFSYRLVVLVTTIELLPLLHLEVDREAVVEEFCEEFSESPSVRIS
jgi:hypothetical protein